MPLYNSFIDLKMSMFKYKFITCLQYFTFLFKTSVNFIFLLLLLKNCCTFYTISQNLVNILGQYFKIISEHTFVLADIEVRHKQICFEIINLQTSDIFLGKGNTIKADLYAKHVSRHSL